jgi:hypothetical protein
MRILSSFGAAVLLAGTCSSTFSEELPGTWSMATPLPQPRAEHSVIGFDGKVYAIAGGIPKVEGEGM